MTDTAEAPINAVGRVPVKRDGEPIGEAALALFRGVGHATHHNIAALAAAAEDGTITHDEAEAALAALAEFIISCCTNQVTGDPAHGRAPVADDDTVKAAMLERFTPIIERAAIDGRDAIVRYIAFVADQAKGEQRH